MGEGFNFSLGPRLILSPALEKKKTVVGWCVMGEGFKFLAVPGQHHLGYSRQ